MRITKITTMLTVGAAAAAVAVPVTAQARQGADDAPGHVRHAQGVDDNARTAGAKAKTWLRTRHHARHGADDGVGHLRHGADDGVGHR